MLEQRGTACRAALECSRASPMDSSVLYLLYSARCCMARGQRLGCGAAWEPTSPLPHRVVSNPELLFLFREMFCNSNCKCDTSSFRGYFGEKNVYCMSLGVFFVLTACSLTEIHYPKRDSGIECFIQHDCSFSVVL